ncbi:MAG TPA: MFS transporter [Mycobacteriales bacterium]|nr:MFS transporter [Mycobacteriales bacterium]
MAEAALERELGGPASRRRDVSRGVLLVSSLGAFLAFLDSTVVNVAFADMQRDFPGADYADLSWVFNSYNITFAALLVTAGRFADLLGRRRVFVAGVAVFTVASIGIAAAPSLGWLIGWRAVQAIGAATLVPASLALVMSAYPPERRAHAIGIWSAAAALASGLGPPLGGVLVDVGGWRLAFLINLPLCIAALWAGRTALVESRAPGRRTLPDIPGSLVLALGLGLVATAVVQGDQWGWSSFRVVGAFVAATALLVGFGRRSARHPSPVLEPALLRQPGFATALVLTTVAGTGFYSYLLTHVLWLTEVWDYSLSQAGAAGAPGAVIAGVVAATLGKLADRRGARVLVIPGALLWASSFVWYLEVVGPTPAYLTEWLPGQVLSGVGIGLTLPVLGSAAVAAVPGGRYATASAVASAVRQLGAVLGISLLVVILGHPASAAQAQAALRRGWGFAAVCFVVVSLGAFALRRPAPVDETVADDLETTVQPFHVPPANAPSPGFVVSASRFELLKTVPVFAQLPIDVLHALAMHCELALVPAGADLFAQGDPADALYVVRTGRLAVRRDGELVDEVVASGVVGELGLLTGAPRAATVTARRDSEVLRVGAQEFATAVGAVPSAPLALAASLAQRLQSGPPPVPPPSPPRVVAVVGTRAPEVAQLLRLPGAVYPGQVAPEALARLESEHPVLVLVATESGLWWDSCVAQADRVVVVADPDEHVPVPGSEVLLVGEASRADLDRWQLAAPLRVTVTREADLERACRQLGDRLSGRSVGLVLSGGGARALAHLGVLAELRDAGVTIGRVAGCSMGAYLAALVAMGLSPEEVDARVYEEWVCRNPTGDWTLPRYALTSGRRGLAMLRRTFGDLDMEALELPLLTSTIDLWARELHHVKTGLVRDAVGGSLALPGIAPPLRVGDRLLADGAFLDNVPVQPLQSHGEGPVILSIVLDTSRAPHGELPPVMETVIRAMTAGSVEQNRRAQEAATLVITPAARGVGLLEFHQLDRMVESGRVATRAALAAMPVGLLTHQGVPGAVRP